MTNNDLLFKKRRQRLLDQPLPSPKATMSDRASEQISWSCPYSTEVCSLLHLLPIVVWYYSVVRPGDREGVDDIQPSKQKTRRARWDLRCIVALYVSVS